MPPAAPARRLTRSPLLRLRSRTRPPAIKAPRQTRPPAPALQARARLPARRLRVIRLRPTTLPRRAAPPRLTRRPPRLRAAATTLPARVIRVQRRPRATTPMAPCRKLHRRFPCSACWASAPWPRAWSAASASNNSHATSSSGPVASRMAGPDLFFTAYVFQSRRPIPPLD